MDPTPKEAQQEHHHHHQKLYSTTSKPSFPSSPLNNKPTSQYPKRNSHHTLQKASDPPRLHTHLHPKAMTLSANEGPSNNLKSTSLPLKKQQRQQHTWPINPTTPSIKEMDKKGAVSKSRSAHKVVDEIRKGDHVDGGEDEKRLVVVADGGRSSFCGSEVELEVAPLFASVGAKVMAKDMPPFMQIHAVTCARKAYDALDKFSAKTMAFTLKKEFDKVYGPAWHCIVGTSFGSFVTHSVGGFLYFSMGKLHILLFKTTVQKAD